MATNPDITVGKLVDQFLAAIKNEVAPSTLYGYSRYLQSFREHAGSERVCDLTGSMALAWISKRHGKLSSSAKNKAVRSVSRMVNWAYNERIIDDKPLRGFRKPQPTSREIRLTGADYAACLKAAAQTQRRDFVARPVKSAVMFLWHTGARPQELRVLRADWLDGQKFVIPRAFTKRKRKDEPLYMDSMSQNIVNRLAHEYPEGPIFRNSRGIAWTKDALSQAFTRLRERTGIKGLCAYALRHTWITRMLERGVDVATVAAMARTSPRMVLDVYNHVMDNEARMIELACA